MFAPDEAVAAVERTKLATKYCAECRVVPVQTGYHGYCKGCYGRKDTVGVEVTEQRCFYCNLTGATVVTCGLATGCSREVAICDVCVSQWEKPVCDVCWGREWSFGCFSCKQPVSSTQAWRVRYCAACYRDKFCNAGIEQPSCWFCNAEATVETRSCEYDADCSGNVNACDRCAKAWGKAVCSACYSRHWSRACFRCKKPIFRFDKEKYAYGHYCEKCFGLATDAGNRETNDAEVAAYNTKLAANAMTPTGEEPALQLLVRLRFNTLLPVAGYMWWAY
jgi:hypothetical protein